MSNKKEGYRKHTNPPQSKKVKRLLTNSQNRNTDHHRLTEEQKNNKPDLFDFKYLLKLNPKIKRYPHGYEGITHGLKCLYQQRLNNPRAIKQYGQTKINLSNPRYSRLGCFGLYLGLAWIPDRLSGV